MPTELDGAFYKLWPFRGKNYKELQEMSIHKVVGHSESFLTQQTF